MGKGTPLEVAERLATEAWKVAEKVQLEDAEDTDGEVQLLSIRAQILERQADIFRQMGRTELSLERLSEALALRKSLEKLDDESKELALAHVGTIDQIGVQHYLNKQIEPANKVFEENHARIASLLKRLPEDLDVLRVHAISCSRLGDVSAAQGDLDAAERWYIEDKQITERIFALSPENAVAQRDLTISLDRLGKTLELRGQLERAIDAWEASRVLRAELLEAEPNDLQAVRDLFVSNFKIGATKMVSQAVRGR